MTQPAISPLAWVDPKAEIAHDVTVHPFAYIQGNVQIGEGSVVMPHAQILDGARIGKHCVIHGGAVIAGIPQDLKFVGEESTAVVGDHTQVRECVTISRGTASRGTTIVGQHCMLMAYSHVAHDCVLQDHIIIGNATQLAGEVEVDDYAIISGGALVHQFTRISKHVMIQGGSRVGKDIPPYTLIGRDPIAYCGINIVGLRRRGFTNEQIFCINDIYRTLYQRGLNITEALEVVEAEVPDCFERNLITDFIRSSKRGIVRGSID
ncbi:UDP-N-acetylglucosamine acyltransferase [Porphyromonas crevioricanis]|uniref:Acyl-[acyl-carrier-protein]--UDP-N-acetylglucosamine O-acyltransferase n=2 Tax=Porphyromonas crevioricanis TaxID=393921 RepID=A0A0A2FDT0_9PORP|nr:acyl-ACP--UDP-N-acetylglucosamine O-acyltransferase [Porphyromonas crevioricanis]KGN89191.1 UDP-N-acetylglucosamine acyltransferase [Porphyromonas crevioricanis]KGN96968.1 UDP-N-acetylglucosamine acyltransferase [Porphyromonas crevioricanis]SJZ99749.1 acyl-[acyl-carrier-protein]--UDP-N-acetylglucosamine O-acyltransferase [Porphyromonas crevioricanis]SQH72452.1 Acyl-[acyl-carrier-protein]--UDP-N-acetylglucosamine O-acyltransferase [Porphyromonas crevioricanis]GAD05200.1 acyl-(acyl-carrier-pr